MGQVFRTQRRVEFRDTDLAGIVHFSVFFTYMEEAEHEFLRQLGMSVIWDTGVQVISWPRVSATCQYRRPVRFEETIDIELQVGRIGDSSVRYDVRFCRQGEPVAHGEVTAVCCEHRPGLPSASMSIPTEVRRRLSPFVGDSNDKG
ncbi:MAG TPA: thioesterase family protein [Pirellulaceae bacterium]|nr:thioesterase family protein [Pirellulaceae bacterium]